MAKKKAEVEAAAKDTNAVVVDSPKVAKQRSPNYPLIDLGKAIEKTKLLHDSYRTMPVSVPTAAIKMGFKAGSSVSGQTVAALRAFGLVVAEGSGETRKVRVSEDGAKIVLNHPKRDSIVQSAALMPRVHREVWDKFYAGKAAPDPDETISYYLQWGREEGLFNKESIAPFIAQFKRTISFAKLDSSSTIPTGTDTSGDDEPNDDEGDGDDMDGKNDNQDKKTKLPPGVREFSFPLMDGVATLRVPHPMGEANYNLLKAVLDATKAALIGPANTADSQ